MQSLRCREPGELLRVLGLNLGCELSGKEMSLEGQGTNHEKPYRSYCSDPGEDDTTWN